MKVTPTCCEPRGPARLDYVLVKISRWDFKETFSYVFLAARLHHEKIKELMNVCSTFEEMIILFMQSMIS
jgi:hypothetical protein